MALTKRKFPKSRVKGGWYTVAATSRSQIKQDLLNQLEAKGQYDKFYIDFIEDYMTLYDVKVKLRADIKKHGLRYKTTNGNGFEIEKPNESIINFTKVNIQMLKILNDLELQKPSELDSGEDDDLLRRS